MVNILTIDVEDYYMVSAFENIVKFEDWDKYESRIVGNTQKILFILKEFDVKATFFVLGWVGEKFPQLVEEIHKHGHEIASHGYAHRLIHNQTIDDFRQDIRKSKMILEKLINESILGYRAPSYSITRNSLWAFDVLMEEGFKYDSSIFPIYHDKGGMPNAKRFPYFIKKNGGGILEIPLSIKRVFGYNIPIAGGGYFRFFPYWFIRDCIKEINDAGYPGVIYFHPWEIDPNQPKIKVKGISRFRHYVNLEKAEIKLRKLLKEFKFSSIKNSNIEKFIFYKS